MKIKKSVPALVEEMDSVLMSMGESKSFKQGIT